MPRMFAAAIVLAIACHAAPVLMASAADLYVSTTGSDTNPGTLSAPLRTIPAASQKATAGTTIYVAPGTYTGGFQTPVSGTATAHIHFVSPIKYGAKLVPPAGSTSGIAWWIRGGYTDVDGFEIDGTSYLGGINWTVGIEADGNYDTVENNLIHNIHDISVTACSGHGAAGIDFYGFNYGHTGGTANANTVHDVTWHGTCSYDNGIYANTPRIVLTNNLVYNIIGSVAIENWHGATKNTIVNNTVYNNWIGIYIGHDTSLGGVNDYTTVSNNIVVNNTFGVAEGEAGTHNTYQNNLLYSNGNDWYDMENFHTGPADADPLFVSRGSDFHLKGASPAIGAGTATNAPSTDLDGNPRPGLTGYSIGSYQYQPPVP